MFQLLLYNALLVALYPLIFTFLFYCGLFNYKYTGTLMQRFGWYGRLPRRKGAIWLHAVSVGEAVGAIPLIRLLLEHSPNKSIVVTTTTKGGMEVLRKTFGNKIASLYFPLDLPWVIGRAFGALKPSVIILMETEIWPNLIWRAKRKNVPVLLLNGRVSDRMASASGFLKSMYTTVFSMIDCLGMQTSADAERIKRLGAPPENVRVVGNIKFDGMMTELDEIKMQELKRTASAGGEQLLVAGSTHPGEEEQLLAVFKKLKEKHNSLRLIIAPRHIERSHEVENVCSSAGFETQLRSGFSSQNPCGGDVVVWDTIGELRYLYSVAQACFVGGSLIERGGHNILEPAACGRAAFYGPHMANFRASADALAAGGGGRGVKDPDELFDALDEYLSSPEEKKRMDAAAFEVVQKNSGASRRAYEIFKLFSVDTE